MPKRPLPKMALFSVIELLWWAHGNAKNGKNSLVLVLIGQSKEKWKNILSKEIHKWCQIVLHEFVLGIGIKSSFSPFFTLFLLLCALANVTFFFSLEASMLKVSWSTAMLKSLFTSMLRQWTSLLAATKYPGRDFHLELHVTLLHRLSLAQH